MTRPDRWQEQPPTAALVLADGTIVEGMGLGAEGEAAGEICFNTAMTGYQEILTDPSYAGQIITFTFPHIGNVGVNDEDIETVNMAAASGVRGCVLKTDITEPSSYRATRGFDAWLRARDIIGIAGVDTRALTALVREKGSPNAVIVHRRDGGFDRERLLGDARAWPGLVGMDLAKEVTTGQSYTWDQTSWQWGRGYGRLERPTRHVVAVDYGIKRNILRILADHGCRVTVLPATATGEEILAHKPDGVFLSNGPGDPAATGEYAVPAIRAGAGFRNSDLRHLPRPPDARHCRRRQDDEDAPGPPRRQSPGKGPHHRQGRDHLDEPRLRGRHRYPAGYGGGDPRLALRRVELRAAPQGAAGLLRAVPPRGVARTARQPLSLPALRRDDGRQGIGSAAMASGGKGVITKARLDALTDGVFAFAMTLLVLNLEFPDDLTITSASQLLDAFAEHASDLLLYVITFFVLGRRWFGQARIRPEPEEASDTYARWVLSASVLHHADAVLDPDRRPLRVRAGDLALCREHHFCGACAIRLTYLAEAESGHSDPDNGRPEFGLLVASAIVSVIVSFFDAGWRCSPISSTSRRLW